MGRISSVLVCSVPFIFIGAGPALTQSVHMGPVVESWSTTCDNGYSTNSCNVSILQPDGGHMEVILVDGVYARGGSQRFKIRNDNLADVWIFLPGEMNPRYSGLWQMDGPNCALPLRANQPLFGAMEAQDGGDTTLLCIN